MAPHYRAAAAFGVASVLIGLTAPAASAASNVIPVRVVPGVPKTFQLCKSGYEFTGNKPTKYGRISLTHPWSAEAVYTPNAGVSGEVDEFFGVCQSTGAPGAYIADVKVTIAPKAVNPVTNTFTRTCDGTSGTGTVEFALTNNDSRRHSVRISSPGLTPTSANVLVSAGSTQSATFQIGSANATVSVSVNGGRAGTGVIDGCAASSDGGGDGGSGGGTTPPVEKGRIWPAGPATGGGYLAMPATTDNTSLNVSDTALGGAGVLVLGGATLAVKRRRAAARS